MAVRLAHFSDVHLLSLEGVRARALLNKRWIGGLNLLTRRRHHQAALFEAMVDDVNAQGVDHAVCTGDITNLALPSEFVFARRLFSRLLGGPDEVTVLPGNHDAYVPEGSAAFDTTFADYFAADQGWGEPWPTVRVRGHVALVALRTSETTAWFMAWGRIGAEQLARLDQILGDPRLEGKLRVVALHHPPAGPRARNRMRGLRDHAALAEVLRRHGAELVLHGHEHADLKESMQGPTRSIPVRGITSGSYDHVSPHRGAAYRIYDLSGGKLVGEELRSWDQATRQFVTRQ